MAAVVFPASSPDLYQPLGEDGFRLLTVLPGVLNDPVRCQLNHSSLTEQPHYETISYCWGDATLRGQIEINGHVTDVTSSAYEAIRRMRLRDAERTLWIDAICIKQADLEERSLQVHSMGKIYRNATGNLIHLGGQEDLDTSEVAATLQTIRRRMQQHARAMPKSERKDFLNYLPPLGFHSPDLVTREDLRMLHPLYALPWFGRLWVVQESVLARRNTCFWGSTTFDLALPPMIAWFAPTNVLRYEYCGSDDSMENFFASRCRHAIRLGGEGGAALSAGWLTDLSPNLKASEPRDRIFAVRDLIIRPGDAGRSIDLLESDYQKSVAHVYRDATRYLLEQHATGTELLDNICHRSDSDIHCDGKTSWTYPWDRQYNPILDTGCLNNGRLRSGMPGGSLPDEPSLEITRSEDLNVLSLDGFFVGTIIETGPIIDQDKLQNYETVRAMVEDVLDFSGDNPRFKAHRSVRTVFKRIRAALCFGSWPDVTLPGTIEEKVAALLFTAVFSSSAEPDELCDEDKRLEAFEVFLADLRSSSSLPCLPNDLPEESAEKARTSSLFFDMLCETTFKRRLCYLDCGDAGVGPKIMRKGDIVVIFQGGSRPHVLRPVDGGQYQFIGAVYIPGLMNAEVFELNIKKKRFDIV
ncbi:hypothetical protein PRZ48_010461 [Zasmidium cellare]|uniref:Heterokaryon incompatibility domain-containing protein n=1 Tax=Zasmidium cellare TaxID=395010 RepID=A0ABR0E8P2_ZASCE|nr:hypothetical protein PRZ48_010461 [Zasmidium cellare]